jgi:hypothetical protein
LLDFRIDRFHFLAFLARFGFFFLERERSLFEFGTFFLQGRNGLVEPHFAYFNFLFGAVDQPVRNSVFLRHLKRKRTSGWPSTNLYIGSSDFSSKSMFALVANGSSLASIFRFE